MKKLLFILITAITLMSCGIDKEAVSFSNGAIVEVVNPSDVKYHIGSKVCVYKTTLSNWTICTDGEMQDTVYTRSYKADGVDRIAVIIHKTGRISSHL
jgi:hypothetical protein